MKALLFLALDFRERERGGVIEIKRVKRHKTEVTKSKSRNEKISDGKNL